MTCLANYRLYRTFVLLRKNPELHAFVSGETSPARTLCYHGNRPHVIVDDDEWYLSNRIINHTDWWEGRGRPDGRNDRQEFLGHQSVWLTTAFMPGDP